ncbi:hypothetical protein [Streptomyces malaysiensis]
MTALWSGAAGMWHSPATTESATTSSRSLQPYELAGPPIGRPSGSGLIRAIFVWSPTAVATGVLRAEDLPAVVTIAVPATADC